MKCEEAYFDPMTTADKIEVRIFREKNQTHITGIKFTNIK